jgi:hypothetical protein
MSASRFVHLDVEEVLRVTDKALLLRVDGEDVWIPLSQIDDAGQYEQGDHDVTVSVTEWIAKQKGLE